MRSVASERSKNDRPFGWAGLRPILGDHIAADALSPIERIFLACDGTFTFQLEALVRERIEIEIIDYREGALGPEEGSHLGRAAGAPVWMRRVLLKGAESGEPYVLADSRIDAERLPAPLRRDLKRSPAGIGRLVVDYRLSIYRDLVGYFFEPAALYKDLLPSTDDRPLLCRAYRVDFDGAPLMLIIEKIPRNLFDRQLR